eukprot:gene9652-11834_t
MSNNNLQQRNNNLQQRNNNRNGETIETIDEYQEGDLHVVTKTVQTQGQVTKTTTKYNRDGRPVSKSTSTSTTTFSGTPNMGVGGGGLGGSGGISGFGNHTAFLDKNFMNNISDSFHRGPLSHISPSEIYEEQQRIKRLQQQQQQSQTQNRIREILDDEDIDDQDVEYIDYTRTTTTATPPNRNNRNNNQNNINRNNRYNNINYIDDEDDDLQRAIRESIPKDQQPMIIDDDEDDDLQRAIRESMKTNQPPPSQQQQQPSRNNHTPPRTPSTVPSSKRVKGSNRHKQKSFDQEDINVDNYNNVDMDEDDFYHEQDSDDIDAEVAFYQENPDAHSYLSPNDKKRLEYQSALKESRRIREEQEREFKESLEKDRLKREEEEEKKQLEEAMKLSLELEKQSKISEKTNRLPPDPTTLPQEKQQPGVKICEISISLPPEGQRITRKFYVTDKLISIRDWIDIHLDNINSPINPDTYELVTTYPRDILSDNSKSLLDLNLYPRAILNLREP